MHRLPYVHLLLASCAFPRSVSESNLQVQSATMSAEGSVVMRRGKHQPGSLAPVSSFQHHEAQFDVLSHSETPHPGLQQTRFIASASQLGADGLEVADDLGSEATSIEPYTVFDLREKEEANKFKNTGTKGGYLKFANVAPEQSRAVRVKKNEMHMGTLKSKELTVDGYLKLASEPEVGSQWHSIIQKNGGFAGGGLWAIRASAGGEFYIHSFKNAAQHTDVNCSDKTSYKEKFVHIALTYKEKVLRLYVAGKLACVVQGSKHDKWSDEGITKSPQSIIMGTDGVNYMDGLVTCMRVWPTYFDEGDIDKVANGDAAACDNIFKVTTPAPLLFKSITAASSSVNLLVIIACMVVAACQPWFW